MVAGEGEDWVGLELRLRARGNLTYWKVQTLGATTGRLVIRLCVQVVLTDSQFLGLTQLYTYEAKFPVETEAEQFTTVQLPFIQFRALYRGQVLQVYVNIFYLSKCRRWRTHQRWTCRRSGRWGCRHLGECTISSNKAESAV